MRVGAAKWFGFFLGGVLLVFVFAWVGLWRAEVPRVEFLEFAPNGEEDWVVVFRLLNQNRFDYHYSIRTLPSLRSEDETVEVGLLPANSLLTNRIPVSVLDRSFKLEARYYRLPILPLRWFVEPSLSWDCIRAFVQGESRLLFSYRGELPTNHLTMATSTLVKGLRTNRVSNVPSDDVED